MKRVLAQCQASLIIVTGAMGGLQFLKNEKPDVLICDIDLKKEGSYMIGLTSNQEDSNGEGRHGRYGKSPAPMRPAINPGIGPRGQGRG